MFSCLCLSFTDDGWEMLQDSNNQHFSIGLFQFHKTAASTYTEANNSWDVLAALHLMVMLCWRISWSVVISHTSATVK